MMAVCGLDCSTCDIRLVPTDPDAARRVVAWFRKMEWLEKDEGVAEIFARAMYCNGCREDRSLHWSPECPLLICCVDERRLAHCAQCDEFVCALLEAFANDGQAHHREAVEHLKHIATSQQYRRTPMERIIAYCGLVCSDCDAYVATQANDREALGRLAQRAREEFGVADATPETSMCDGCLTDTGRQIGYCATCEIRSCATARDVANCAYCADYACDKLETIFSHSAEARALLDEIHASL
jgi:hypothetical protein